MGSAATLLASPSNQSPSVGLAVVDSMAARRIKAFGSHAQAFYAAGLQRG
jgi:hypothetical protein